MNEHAPAAHHHELPDQAGLERLVGEVLETARAQGAAAAEVTASHEAGLSATVRMGDVETLEYNRDRGLAVTVYFGNRKGSASTADLSSEAVRQTVQQACAIARYTTEDACAGLADPARVARDVPDLALYHAWGLTPDAAIERALACESAARAYDPRIDNSEGASVSSHSGVTVYGNTHGFIGGYPGTQHSIACAVIGRHDDRMQRDHWFTIARDPAELEPA
nr:metalloprotease PmbA [Gammaproteobacteria bacterium]